LGADSFYFGNFIKRFNVNLFGFMSVSLMLHSGSFSDFFK